MSVSSPAAFEHASERARPNHKERAFPGWTLLAIPLCVALAWLYAQTLLHYKSIGARDFLQEWTSAKNWQTGRPIYAPLCETLPVYFAPGARAAFDINAHPPTAVLVALPFAALSYEQAWGWWNLASLAAVAFSLWLILGRLGVSYPAWAWCPAFLLVLSSNALKEQVQQGQLTGILLLLITASWVLQRHRRSVAAGACIGAAAAIKLFPAFLILYFLARRDWRACLATAGTCALLTLLTGSALGWAAYRDYVVLVLPTLGQFQTSWLNSSLHGFWSKLLIGRPPEMIPLLASPFLARIAIWVSVAAVAGVVVWRAAAAASQSARDRSFACAVSGMLLVSPITWDHAYLLLIPTLLILWHSWRSPAARVMLGVIAVTLLTIRPGWIFEAAIPGNGEMAALVGLPPSLVLPHMTLTALSYQFYALVGLFLMSAASAEHLRGNHGTAKQSTGIER